MLCSGEPGIGKSSLLRRFVHAAGRRRTAFSRPTALVRMMAVNSQPMGVDLLHTESFSEIADMRKSLGCSQQAAIQYS